MGTEWIKHDGGIKRPQTLDANDRVDVKLFGDEEVLPRIVAANAAWGNIGYYRVVEKAEPKPESPIELFPTRFEAYDPATKDLLFTMEAFDEGAATLNMVGCLTPRNIDEVLEQIRTAFDALKLK